MVQLKMDLKIQQWKMRSFHVKALNLLNEISNLERRGIRDLRRVKEVAIVLWKTRDLLGKH